jgi:hypothetical protein
MAIISCPGCNRDVSDGLPYCPACGHPILEMGLSGRRGSRVPLGRSQITLRYRWILLVSLILGIAGFFVSSKIPLVLATLGFLFAALGIVVDTFRFSGDPTPGGKDEEEEEEDEY